GPIGLMGYMVSYGEWLFSLEVASVWLDLETEHATLKGALALRCLQRVLAARPAGTSRSQPRTLVLGSAAAPAPVSPAGTADRPASSSVPTGLTGKGKSLYPGLKPWAEIMPSLRDEGPNSVGLDEEPSGRPKPLVASLLPFRYR